MLETTPRGTGGPNVAETRRENRETHTKVIKAESTRYKSLVDKFETLWTTDFEGWSGSNMNARWQVLQVEKSELAKAAAIINSVMNKVKEKADEGRKARSQESANRARARNKAILKWKLKGDEHAPMEFLRYLYVRAFSFRKTSCPRMGPR